MKEFTEDDLKVIEDKKYQSNDDTPVKSIPKQSSNNKKEELLNPYTNPNLDADLSATIGKLSKSIGNRKHINTTAFQLPD